VVLGCLRLIEEIKSPCGVRGLWDVGSSEDFTAASIIISAFVSKRVPKYN
jgi:hypothetical protein